MPGSLPVRTYQDLLVWQRAVDLVIGIYELTEQFPRSELYGLTSQMRRAAVSIPSNIAEGRRRGTRRDFRNFLVTAYGSGAELETQIIIAKRLSFALPQSFEVVDRQLDEVMRMLNRMVVSLQATREESLQAKKLRSYKHV